MPKPKIDQSRIDNFTKSLNIIMLAFAREFPFWGVMSERCRFAIVAGKDHFCQTACIDKSGNITFNLDFFDTLTPKQFLTLVAHEICHFIFEHNQRKGAKDHFVWNCATDYAINLMLKFQFEKQEFYLKDWLLDDKYEGFTAERIYEDLQNNPPPFLKGGKGGRVFIVDLTDEPGEGGDGDGEKPGEGDTVIIRDRRVPLPEKPDAKNGKSAEQYDQEMKDYIRGAICEAYACAKNQGLMPAGMERIIVGYLKPKVNWLQALRQKLRFGCSRKASRDITWTQPNRRFLGASFIFPSNVGPDAPKIAFAIDTSGSMSEKDLKQAVSEL